MIIELGESSTARKRQRHADASTALNPYVFQTMQLLQENLEENTGVSSLSTGMNKDAVSKQNSAALVEQLATMSQQRQNHLNFANQFVKPLFRGYTLVVENGRRKKSSSWLDHMSRSALPPGKNNAMRWLSCGSATLNRKKKHRKCCSFTRCSARTHPCSRCTALRTAIR